MFSTWMLVLLLLTGLATLGLGVYAWRQRRAPGTRPMAAVLVFSGVWSLAYSIQLLNSDLSAKTLAFKVYFTAVPMYPVVWAVLGVELRQRAFWFTWPRFAALLVVPAITIALTWTVEAHPWLFPNLRVMASPPLLLLDSDIGPWFWIHTVYSYVLILSGTAFLIPRMLSERGLYRWQAGLLALAPLVPLGANLVYILGL
ncbi:MAG TPA: histidine kinase N-terminal 7TM domain-containing protein, partial [Anaerolineales bacterium]|nr:histidine kinase N-terminal 7TM domain-containing protein [Anaerolineales bacterium]